MKTPLIFLTSWIIIGLYACGPNSNPFIEQPIPNTDSIQCAQAWQSFQLPRDTILALHYQQPVKLVNGSDTMAITVVDIDDFCSEESAKITYGCEARIKLKIVLNGACAYQMKNQLVIGRSSDITGGITFKDFGCKVQYNGNSAPIADVPIGPFGFYNTAILFRRLLPFAKTDAELFQLFAAKHQYTVILWLKKRCF